MINGHGDDAWKFSVPIRTDFSSNVLYGGLDEGLRAHLTGAMEGVTHYPEAGAQSLQQAAAVAYGLSPEEVLVTNGATEAIYLIAQAFRRLAVTVVGPTFAEYADACALQGMEVRWMGWEEIFNVALSGLVFICNPNNPTGKAIAAEQLAALADRYADTLFVIDESYIEFTLATRSVLTARRPNVLVLRSLTKSCRIPGLRVGFLLGPSRWIDVVGKYKMPWSVNRLAVEAGLYVFRHRERFVVPLDALLTRTAEWRRELAAATGWRVWDTDTHYFLFSGIGGLKERLVQQYGLLVRDAANFHGLGPNMYRLACQTPEENQLLTEALRECSRGGI